MFKQRVSTFTDHTYKNQPITERRCTVKSQDTRSVEHRHGSGSRSLPSVRRLLTLFVLPLSFGGVDRIAELKELVFTVCRDQAPTPDQIFVPFDPLY